jgi:hypothetical protein
MNNYNLKTYREKKSQELNERSFALDQDILQLTKLKGLIEYELKNKSEYVESEVANNKKLDPPTSVKSTAIEVEKENFTENKILKIEKSRKLSDVRTDIDESIPIRENNDYCYNSCGIF